MGRAALHRQGLVRYASMPYSEAEHALDDPRVHLTYIRGRDAALHRKARQRNCSLTDLRTFIRETRGCDEDQALWNSLAETVWQTLASAPPTNHARNSHHCQGGVCDFELFGFDV